MAWRFEVLGDKLEDMMTMVCWSLSVRTWGATYWLVLTGCVRGWIEEPPRWMRRELGAVPRYCNQTRWLSVGVKERREGRRVRPSNQSSFTSVSRVAGGAAGGAVLPLPLGAVGRAPRRQTLGMTFSVRVAFTGLWVTLSASAPLMDKNADCARWADAGECDNNPGFMMASCAASCSSNRDDAPRAECLLADCANPKYALDRCRSSCYKRLRSNLTDDQMGNCWYWGTDGECQANAQWMSSSCARSCRKLVACAGAPESPECAEPFECPLERDRDEAGCAERARRGECRSGSVWNGDSLLLRCPYSCAVLDPPSASHTVTRPMVKRSARIDAALAWHTPNACPMVGLRRALLGGTCPHPVDVAEDATVSIAAGDAAARPAARAPVPPSNPWHRRRRHCPLSPSGGSLRRDMTPRLSQAELPQPTELPERTRSKLLPSDHPAVTLQLVYHSPRVRLLHNFVSAAEAEHLISMATPYYHRSSTARAGSDDKRTSHSATLPSHDPIVAAIRERIAYFCGYPEPNLEPLQAVRYHAGEFYKPHHDVRLHSSNPGPRHAR